MQKKNLLDCSAQELNGFVKEHGLPAFRGTQIRKWLYTGVTSFEEMSDLPKDMRAWLDQYCSTGLPKIKRLLKSSLDGTCKYLFDLGDGNFIESVLMKYKYGYSACISSQVGCKMQCSFCASTGAGFVRNLTAGEMLGQIIAINKDRDIRIGHVVIMGVGEPMDNYDNVIAFLHEAQSESGLGIGYRHISLSTCGVVPGIYKLEEEKLPITLSVSLHSPFDAQRSQMMPVNRRYPIAELITACKKYLEATGRRITFEYAMIAGINDTREHAKALCDLLRGMLCHVNLIPVNKVAGNGYTRSEQKEIENFMRILQENGIEVTMRRELGRDISAACGQLRRTAQERATE